MAVLAGFLAASQEILTIVKYLSGSRTSWTGKAFLYFLPRVLGAMAPYEHLDPHLFAAEFLRIRVASEVNIDLAALPFFPVSVIKIGRAHV